MESKINVCPFCGSTKIDYSVKTTGRWERKYHVAMYCRDCNCYGKRVLITPAEEETRFEVERNPQYKQLAIDAWNTRKPMERIIERLEEEERTLQDKYERNLKKEYDDPFVSGRLCELECVIETVKEEGGIE